RDSFPASASALAADAQAVRPHRLNGDAMLNVGALVVALLALQGPEAAPPQRIGFPGPKAPWRIGVPADTCEVKDKSLKPDGIVGYFMLWFGACGMMFSMFMAQVKACSPAVACREC